MVHKICRFIPTLSVLFLFVVMSTGLAPEASGAGPVYWDWPQVQPFVDLELDGTTVNSQGFLTVGLAATSFSGEGPEVYWRAIADGRGGYFTGTGHGGKILRTDKNGEVSLFAELGGTEVFSLLLLDDGSLLAGCGPEGEVYQVDKNGTANLVGSVPGGYAWAMTQDQHSGDVYIAAGSPAALYLFQGEDGLDLIQEFPAQNALAVTMDSDGGILVATQGPGRVYQLAAKSQESRLILETDQDEVRKFIKGPGDNLYVIAFNGQEQDSSLKGGLPPEGKSDSAAAFNLLFGDSEAEVTRSAIYRLDNNGDATIVWTSTTELMIVTWHQNFGWLAGGELDEESGQSILYALDFPSGEHPLSRWDGGDILDILVTGGSGSDAD